MSQNFLERHSSLYSYLLLQNNRSTLDLGMGNAKEQSTLRRKGQLVGLENPDIDLANRFQKAPSNSQHKVNSLCRHICRQINGSTPSVLASDVATFRCLIASNGPRKALIPVYLCLCRVSNPDLTLAWAA